MSSPTLRTLKKLTRKQRKYDYNVSKRWVCWDETEGYFRKVVFDYIPKLNRKAYARKRV